MKRRIATLFLMMGLAIPIYAQDTPGHYFGSGRATLVNYWNPSETCSYMADIEVHSIRLPFFAEAFTYTMRNMVWEDSNCFSVPDDPFNALCRAWVTSTGTANIDVVGFGTLTLTPRDPHIKRILKESVANAAFGFGAVYLNYRVSVLPDGGVQIFAYR